jgi:rod shape-determining protein MreD
MKVLAGFGVLVAAVLAQTTIAGVLGRQTVAVDLVLVAVVALALAGGPSAGVAAGTVGGLVQDALSSGILGVGGLAKTVVGFLVGRFGSQFIVTATVPRLLTFAAATVAHDVLFMGVYSVLGARQFPTALRDIAVQAVANAIVGVAGVHLADRLPRTIERRRATRGLRVSR